MTSLSSPVWPLKGRREVLNWTEVDSLGNWSSAGQMQSVKEDTYILLKMKANSQSYDRLHKRVLEVRRRSSIQKSRPDKLQHPILADLFRTTAHQKGTTRLYSSRRVEERVEHHHHPLFITLGQNPFCPPKIHIFISFLAKFTFSNYHF